jgi:hypothetical protein
MALVGVEGTEFVKRLCEALGISYDQGSRIIIDIKSDCVITAYVKMVASNKILDLDWASALDRAVVMAPDKDT